MEKNDLSSRIGIQSWCFRAFKGAPQVIDGLRKAGVSNLEICGVHVDVAKNAAETLKTYSDAGIAFSAYGVCGFNAKDETAARKVFEFAKLSGFDTIGADLADRDASLALVERLCSEYGKRIAIHNHGRKHALGSVRALEGLFAKSSPAVGLCLDTAWMLDSGENPLEVARKFKDRLYGVHIKDFVFDRAGRPEDVVAGTGNLDLPALGGFLKEIKFGGYITIEYEGDETNPVPALTECVRNLRAALA